MDHIGKAESLHMTKPKPDISLDELKNRIDNGCDLPADPDEAAIDADIERLTIGNLWYGYFSDARSTGTIGTD